MTENCTLKAAFWTLVGLPPGGHCLDALGGDAMQSSTLDLPSLAARVEILERQNRMFKRAALALLLLPVALLVMGQARPNRTVEARSFVLRDSGGVKKAELTVLDSGPALQFFDSKGVETAYLSPVGYVIFGGNRKFGNANLRVIRLGLNESGLSFEDERGEYVIQLGGPNTTLSDLAPDVPYPPLPALQLIDAHGFSAALGSADLVTSRTGEQRKTSAASLILSGKDGNVLWSAP
jgi:hypothetical protein